VNAVHKRIQALIEDGVIRSFYTRIRMPYAGVSPIMVYGQLERPLDDAMYEAAASVPEVNWVGEASGNIAYVTGHLRQAQDMAPFVTRVRAILPFIRPQVGVTFLPEPAEKVELNKLDRAIVASLRGDSRKRVSDIAEEVNASAKTVGRRLERMVKGEVLESTIDWYPDASSDIFAYLHIEMTMEVYPMMVRLQQYFPRVLFCQPFSNEPRTMLCMAWGNTTREIKEIRAEISRIDGVISVTPNIIIGGRIYRTWLDALP
jgi:DNA-binding Lrp family transcriptional regulator